MQSNLTRCQEGGCCFLLFSHPSTWNQKPGYLNLSPSFPVPYYQATGLWQSRHHHC